RVFTTSLSKLTKNQKLSPQFCQQLNISACPATESGDSFVATFYNPLGHEVRNQSVRFPVKSGVHYEVRCLKNQPLAAALVATPEGVKNIRGRKSVATHELVFSVELPPLGAVTYSVLASQSKSEHAAPVLPKKKVAETVHLKSKTFEVVF